MPESISIKRKKSSEKKVVKAALENLGAEEREIAKAHDKTLEEDGQAHCFHIVMTLRRGMTDKSNYTCSYHLPYASIKLPFNEQIKHKYYLSWEKKPTV